MCLTQFGGMEATEFIIHFFSCCRLTAACFETRDTTYTYLVMIMGLVLA
jgi:hypothetical protein